MKVMRGFSGETANGCWDKIEIELNDTDLERLVKQYLPELIDPLRIEQSFQLLELQTEILLTAELGIRFHRNVTDQMQKLLTDRKDLIKKIQE